MSTKKADSVTDTVLSFISKFSSGGMRLMSDDTAGRVEAVSTGNIAIDIASGIGGFPRGRAVEIFGPESSGKTTVCLQACAEFNKLGEYVLFLDFEHALDIDYAVDLGCKKKKFIVSQPDTAEGGYDEAFDAVRAGVKCIVIDSIAAMTTRQELNGEIGDANIGSLARLQSQTMKKFMAILSVHNATAIYTNQVREKVGVMYGSPITTPGGRASKFYCSMRMEVKRVSQPNKDGDVAVSSSTTVKFVKNKLAPPFTEAKFDIVYGQGADNVSAIIELAESAKVIKKKGSWFSHEGQLLAQGEKRLNALLSSDPDLYQKIKEQTIATIKPAKVEEEDTKPKPKPLKLGAPKEVSVTETESAPKVKMRSVFRDDE